MFYILIYLVDFVEEVFLIFAKSTEKKSSIYKVLVVLIFLFSEKEVMKDSFKILNQTKFKLNLFDLYFEFVIKN
jgi:hypothetical protein